MLGPDEQFTILRLSGDKPKRPNVINSLCMMLGPDFMTDIITVETSDHARLQLTLSYNWQFEIDQNDLPGSAAAIFSVRDFTGDACKAIASRVRGAVVGTIFPFLSFPFLSYPFLLRTKISYVQVSQRQHKTHHNNNKKQKQKTNSPQQQQKNKKQKTICIYIYIFPNGTGR